MNCYILLCKDFNLVRQLCTDYVPWKALGGEEGGVLLKINRLNHPRTGNFHH